ncbi:hypothetical protein SK128_000587 [Halocaridina rubra]|uniref:Uncharacterized protein n=1 Tax=Halocaridina rubra TaxID=373956 RepID=A0AAN8XKC9_HALRR
MQPVKNLTDHEESLQNPIRTMTISIDESRILDQLDTSTDIAINEEKKFSTVDTLGDEVSLPTEFPQLKEMSSTVLEESLVDTQKNEIVPTEQNLLLSLLQPPVHEFTFEVAKASEGEDDRSAMAILRRKETFSWALTDAGTE